MTIYTTNLITLLFLIMFWKNKRHYSFLKMFYISIYNLFKKYIFKTLKNDYFYKYCQLI